MLEKFFKSKPASKLANTNNKLKNTNNKPNNTNKPNHTYNKYADRRRANALLNAKNYWYRRTNRAKTPPSRSPSPDPATTAYFLLMRAHHSLENPTRGLNYKAGPNYTRTNALSQAGNNAKQRALQRASYPKSHSFANALMS